MVVTWLTWLMTCAGASSFFWKDLKFWDKRILSVVYKHTEISFRTPENLSMAHIQGFTKENVELNFSMSKDELEKMLKICL